MVYKKSKNKTRKIKGGKDDYESREIIIDFYPSLINGNQEKSSRIDTFQYTPVVRVVNSNEHIVDDIFTHENWIQNIKNVELEYLKDAEKVKEKLKPVRTKRIKIERKRNVRPDFAPEDPEQEMKREIGELEKRIDALKNQIKEMKEEEARRPTTGMSGGTTVDELNATVNDLEGELNTKMEKLKKIQSSDKYLKELEEELKKIQEKREEIKKEIEKENAGKEEEQRAINKIISDKVKNRKATIKASLEDLKKGAVHFLKNQETINNTELREQKKTNKALEKQIAETKAEIEAVKTEQVNNISGVLEIMEKDIDDEEYKKQILANVFKREILQGAVTKRIYKKTGETINKGLDTVKSKYTEMKSELAKGFKSIVDLKNYITSKLNSITIPEIPDLGINHNAKYAELKVLFFSKKNELSTLLNNAKSDDEKAEINKTTESIVDFSNELNKTFDDYEQRKKHIDALYAKYIKPKTGGKTRRKRVRNSRSAKKRK